MERNERGSRSRQMFGLIAQWQESGKTQKAFCEERGQNRGVFQYWLHRYREHAESAVGFAQLEIHSPGAL